MTVATPATLKVAEDGEADLTLHDRLLAITEEIAVTGTGSNQFKKDGVISIEDMEGALKPLLVKHGVVTQVQNIALVYGDNKLWLAEMQVTFINVDKPDDTMVVQWHDVGNTPAGATSFAVKNIYKKIFHVASNDEDEDSAAKPPPARNAPKPVQQAVAAANAPPAAPQAQPEAAPRTTDGVAQTDLLSDAQQAALVKAYGNRAVLLAVLKKYFMGPKQKIEALTVSDSKILLDKKDRWATQFTQSE